MQHANRRAKHYGSSPRATQLCHRVLVVTRFSQDLPIEHRALVRTNHHRRGFLRGVGNDYRAWYRADFHPDDIDDREAIASHAARLAPVIAH